MAQSSGVPMNGVSMAYTWDKANAGVASTRKTQYFEIMGMRAIYSDGWIASTTPPAAPWAMGLAKLPDDLIHAPWDAGVALIRAGVKLGRDYPAPIVNHEAARARALQAFAVARGRP